MTEVPISVGLISDPNIDSHHLLAYYLNMTEKRKKLLEYINRYRSENGGSPTIREMAFGAGIADSKSVFRMLDSLIDGGYLEKEEHKARSLRLTEQALNHLGATALVLRYAVDQPGVAVVMSGHSVSYGRSSINTDATSINGNINFNF